VILPVIPALVWMTGWPVERTEKNEKGPDDHHPALFFA
jgi:hypothetical protein